MGAVAVASAVAYLTDYARGIGPGEIDPAAEILAPTVPVATAAAKYKSFDDKNAFQVPDTMRAIGGPANRLHFDASDPDFNCLPNALEITVDDAERKGGDIVGIEQAKTKVLVTSAMRAHSVQVANKALTLSAAATPAWSDPAVGNPIKDVNDQIHALSTAVGAMPTHIVWGLTAWRYFSEHEKVAAKFKSGVITPGAIKAANLLLNPNIEHVITPLVKDTAKAGAAKSNSEVYGANLFIFFRSASPTLFDPSFMKTFRVGGNTIEAVSMYRDERSSSDVLKVDWMQGVYVVSTVSARRLTIG